MNFELECVDDGVAPQNQLAQLVFLHRDIFTAVVCLIATAAALTAKETKDVPTAELGDKPTTARNLVDH